MHFLLKTYLFLKNLGGLLMSVLNAILLIVISLFSYNLLKIFVFSNIKINKWIILIGFIVCSGSSIVIKLPVLAMYFVQWLYFILILWFVDLLVDERREKRKNKNKKVIQNRPKPKPNRVKTNK